MRVESYHEGKSIATGGLAIRRQDRPRYMPSAADIAEACAEIQSGWSEGRRRARAGGLAELRAVEHTGKAGEKTLRRRLAACYVPRRVRRRNVEATDLALAIEADVQREVAKPVQTEPVSCTALIRRSYDRRVWKKVLRRWRREFGCCCGINADKRRLRLWQANPYCLYCGIRLRFELATLDHVRAKGCGGTDTEDNVVLACKRCNNAKAAMPIQEFAEYLRQWASRVSALAQQWPEGDFDKCEPVAA